MNPEITVLMSVYNGEKFIGEAIESILNQTFSNFEFIIMDDLSTDKSWEILVDYAARDPRIVLIKNTSNIGLTRSLNKGLTLSKGKYIARQDADDISQKDRFEKQIKFLDAHSKVILVSCNIEFIDSDGHIIGQSQKESDPDLIAWYLLFYNYLGGHSQVMFRREPVVDLGGYAEDHRYSQDYWLWLQLVDMGDIVILPEILLRWRHHGGNISSNAGLEQETYSLTDSKNRITQLIGEDTSIAEIAELRGFWLGKFPDSCQVSTLYAKLKKIYKAFLQKNVQRNGQKSSFDKITSCQLRILIRTQFFRWMRTLSIRDNFISKLKITIYALAWIKL